MARGPKSHHRDGTPKKRWSAEQRAARGHAPRRRGGQRAADDQPRNRAERRAAQFADYSDGREGFKPRFDQRDGFDGRNKAYSKPKNREGGFDRERFGKGRDEDKFSRGGKPRYERSNGFEAERYGRPYKHPADASKDKYRDKPHKRRDERPGASTRRDERGFRGEQFERADRGLRENRFERAGRDSRDTRSVSANRFDKGERGYRNERQSRYQREDRFGRLDRGTRADRFVRSERRQDFQAPSDADQMDWEATTIIAEEGVVNGFTELGVADSMVAVLAAQGITSPFAIQEATIRDAIAGHDVLGRAKTGSGKTLAFGLAMLTRLSTGKGLGPRGIVLSPTRELALQIADNLAPLAKACGLEVQLVAGGMSYNPQIRAFQRGVDVVIATPGRLIDLMEQGAADLSNVEITVLDEADHMADMGFTDEVTAILDATPAGGQRLLFSATLDEAVDRIVRNYLSDPITHEVDSDRGSVTTMSHLALQTRPHEKIRVTAEIAYRAGRTVIFARTQKGTDRIAGQLREAGVMAGALHGGLTQGARARILAAFKSGDVPVLVATDVAARGIHVDDVSLVLQVDPPRDSKDYLHRAGRTARAGLAGTVATIVLPHQRRLMRRLLGQAGVDAQYVDALPGSDELSGLTGSRRVGRTPIAESEYLALIKPKQPPARQGYKKRGFRRRRF